MGSQSRWPVAVHVLLALCSVFFADATCPLRGEIIVTEIHYAPVDASGAPQNDLEFVEIFNDGPEPYDLYRYRFTRGVDFEFTNRFFLDGRSYLAVCKSVSAVKAAYGIDNAVGNFTRVLDNAGETVELSNPQGIPVCRVEYNDRGRWPAGAKGTGHSLAILDPYSDPSDPDSWTISAQMGGTPGMPNFGEEPSYQDTPLIDVGESWRYFKGTKEPSSPTSAWRQLGFGDSAWLSGPTGIGYGDGDDATVLTDMENGYLTIFCRKTFTVSDVSRVENLVLSITYDDGFYAYLNGTEVASKNVAGRDYNDEAAGSIEPTTEDIDLTARKSLLADGSNVLAVQVHNSGLGSSDLSFIPKLVSRKLITPEATETIPVLINEGFFRNAGAGERFVELYNTSGAAVNLSGFFLTDDFANLRKYSIPDGTILAARGLLGFSESQLGLDLAFVPVSRERISIALTNPSGNRVVDAVIFEPKVEGRSEARVPDGDRKFAPAADPTPGSANRITVGGDVVFNEIMYHPLSGQPEEEYVEFYNRGGSTVDLTGWSVEGLDFEFPPGTTIGSGAYLVIAKSPDSLRVTYGLSGATVIPKAFAGTLRDGGERLDLKDSRANVVDTIRYHDGGEWPLWADGGGSSLERIDPHAETDAAGTWDASDDSAGAQVQTFTYSNAPFGFGESDFGMMLAAEGIAIIDDVSLIHSGSSTNLIGNGTFDAGTSPWRMQGTHIRSGRTTSPDDVLSGGGSLKLICWNGGGDYKVNRIETDTATQTTGTYTVSFKARWVVGSPRVITIGDYNVGQPGNPGLAGSNLLAVPVKLGTPGAINGVTLRQIERSGSSNIGPSIEAIHSPGVPEGGETVTVSARFRDPDGVSGATLFYRTESPTGAFTSRSMSDPDGDGVYTATIPGQSAGVRVLFYVEATDRLGARSRFPFDVLARTHPPVVDLASAAPSDLRYCIYRHDTRIVSTRYHSYRFVLDQESQSYLGTRQQLSNETVEGTFIFGSDKVYYNTGIRFAGSPWLRNNIWGNSYFVRMPKDRWLHGRKRTFSLDQHGPDGRERISHYLLRMNAGYTRLPYYDFQALVRLQINSVRDSTYEAIDKPNSQYFDFWFPDEANGQIFEMDDRFSFNDGVGMTGNAEGKVLFPPYGATTGGSDKENYRWYFNPRNFANEDYFGNLQSLCAVMDSRVTPNADFDQLVFDSLDVEEVLRVWGIRMNTDDWDTWGGNRGKNCYFYQSTTTGRWTLVPWDLELTYGNADSFGLPTSPTAMISNHFSEIQRMLNRPRTRRMYYGILAEQVSQTNGFFHSAFLGAYMQKLSASGVQNTGIGQSGGFIDQRANKIRSWIRPAIYPQVRLRITTNDGNPFAAVEPFVDLQGDAPADIFFLVVQRNAEVLDDPAPEVQFSDSNMTGWSVRQIPLGPGESTIAILGFGSVGNLVDQASIEITSTVNWNPPVISVVRPASAAPGDSVTITGTDLHDRLKVLFGGSTRAASVRFSEATDPTQIVAVVPEGLAPGATDVRVENVDGQESTPLDFTVLEPLAVFIRGDANSSGVVDISDALRILLHLFHGVEVECLDALDADDKGDVNVTDALFVLLHLFQRGPAPPAPYPSKGSDPTREDSLDCSVALP